MTRVAGSSQRPTWYGHRGTAVPESGRRAAFAIRHIVNNAGIGLGSVAAGLALHGLDTPAGTLRWLYLANGLAALPLIAVILGVRPRARTAARERPGGAQAVRARRSTYRSPPRARPMALLILAQALFAIVGFTRIEGDRTAAVARPDGGHSGLGQRGGRGQPPA
ncbi:hypothetical protein SANTM175S_07252 [Streptomyces antimycoticus]